MSSWYFFPFEDNVHSCVLCLYFYKLSLKAIKIVLSVSWAAVTQKVKNILMSRYVQFPEAFVAYNILVNIHMPVWTHID